MEKIAIVLEPADMITFKLIEKTSPKATLTISNSSEFHHITFKVKTTRPLRYLVRPNQGVIGPKGTACVSVILQMKDCNEVLALDVKERLKSNDKFLVQSATVDDDFCNSIMDLASKDVTELLTEKWAHFEKTQVTNKKLRCAFQVDAAQAASVSSPKVVTFDEDPTSTTTTATKEDLFQEMSNIRKKYDELVAFTVQLTAQRDTLINDIEKNRQQLKQAKMETELANHESVGLRQQKTSSTANTSSHSTTTTTTTTTKAFGLVHVLIAAIVFYVLGRYTTS